MGCLWYKQENISKKYNEIYIFAKKNEEGMGWIVCDRVQIADPKERKPPPRIARGILQAIKTN